MDLLFKRYADPFSFIRGTISAGRFSDFVDDFMLTVSKEREEEVNWEYFLHRVWDKSYKAFVDEMKSNKENKGMTEKTIETTINDSLKILKNFNPVENGGER